MNAHWLNIRCKSLQCLGTTACHASHGMQLAQNLVWMAQKPFLQLPPVLPLRRWLGRDRLARPEIRAQFSPPAHQQGCFCGQTGARELPLFSCRVTRVGRPSPLAFRGPN